jgi:hypothetical protein
VKTFDSQTVEIGAPLSEVFRYVSDPANLPEWAEAFERAGSDGRAVLRTPGGSVEIALDVHASPEQGTVDWVLRFPDGSAGRAFSRLVPAGERRTIYTFVLTPPPVPLEALEGALEEQARTLRRELARLRERLSAPP